MTPDPSAGARSRPLRSQRLGPVPALLAGLLASALLLFLYARFEAAWPLGFVLLVPWLLALDRAQSGRGVLLSALLMGFAWGAAGMIFVPLTGWLADRTSLHTALASLLVFPVLGYWLSRRLPEDLAE